MRSADTVPSGPDTETVSFYELLLETVSASFPEESPIVTSSEVLCAILIETGLCIDAVAEPGGDRGFEESSSADFYSN